MSLLGNAIVAIWNDIKPEMRAEFYEWHSREHMLERVGIPGFLRGRRLIADRGHPEWFTLYEVDAPGTLAGSEYLARLNTPTDWTRKVVPSFTDVTRSLCNTKYTTGSGVGGAMVTLRCDSMPGRATELESYFERMLPELAKLPRVHGAHLCRLETRASSIQTEERKVRSNGNLLAEFVVMIEASVPDALDIVVSEFNVDQLLKAGASNKAPLEVGLYRLEFIC
ncbi:MAG: hypothetical protein K0S56_1017 [Microvirga sp.]|jgi:hypothetical protein|nr:hypothetical protein [Microvirga sp.]